MSGVINMNGWESQKEDQQGKRKVAKTMATQFPYTVEGCSKARQFLANRGESILSQITGWDIVLKANELMIDDKVRSLR